MLLGIIGAHHTQGFRYCADGSRGGSVTSDGRVWFRTKIAMEGSFPAQWFRNRIMLNMGVAYVIHIYTYIAYVFLQPETLALQQLA